MNLDETAFGLGGDVPAALARQMADLSPVVTVLVEAPGFRIVYANRAAYRAAAVPGVSDDGDLIGLLATKAFAFVDPELLATKSHAQARGVADRRGDSTIWWDVSYAALETPAAEARTVLINAVDVTHHEAARAKAQAAQDTLDALLAYIPEGISISHGPEVHVDRISARGMSLLGRNADELTGRSALRQTVEWEVYRPGSDVPLPPTDRPLARATRTGEVTMNETLVVRHRDGRLLTLLCNSGPIRDAGGRVTGAAMAWHDVTELQRTQAALRDSEERLRAVLVQIPAAIFIVAAPDGRVTFKSRLLDEVLGNPECGDLARAKATQLGWAVHKDGSPYDISEYPSRRALFNGETVRAEPMLYRRGDGKLIDLEMHAGPIRGETGEIVAAVAVAMDVTERRLAEARQAFLFQLQDSLHGLTEPREILSGAATQLGRHLGAARICYGEVQPDGETMLITNGYVDGMKPLNGLYPLTLFGADHAARLRQGQTVAYQDVQAEPFSAESFGHALGTRAHVTVPLIRGRRYIGSLCVTHREPHEWKPDEITLIEEVAARIWDAAERGRAEARLRDSEERLRLVLDSTGLGSWEYDVVSGTTIRSSRHDEIFGYPAPLNDWSYERFESHIAEADRARFGAGFRAALAQAEDWDVECQMTRADGSSGWLKVRATPHRGPDGQVTRLLGTVADITERKQAEKAVIETAAKFETFAQTMPSMVWSSLPDGQIDWFNARVPEYCGIPPEKMKPNGWAPVHPDDMASAITAWREALASGKPFETEYRILRHDGVYRWHITRAVPIRGADGAISLWIGTSADIQDQKSSEQALAQLNATLEQQVRERTAELMAAEATLRQSQKMEAVGQLTGGLAHDFNNLLQVILGSLDRLAARLRDPTHRIDERDLRLIDAANRGAERAASLTRRLLAFSRRQTLTPVPVDLNRLVSGMSDLLPRTLGPEIAVRTVLNEAAWTVFVDENQLENALLNLAVNARDAMPDGGSLTIAINNTSVREGETPGDEVVQGEIVAGDYAEIAVTDTGVGMTDEVLAKAFDPFYTTKDIGQGTGLGLSQVYGFVSQSGGHVRVVSAPGRGTSVRLCLPRLLDADSVISQKPEPAPELPIPRGDGRETILVVDDEIDVRTGTVETLRGLGYDVIEAQDGHAALRQLDSVSRIRLLFTDVGLPGGMNGVQLAEAARRQRPDLLVLFTTGYARDAFAEGSPLTTGAEVLAKPFNNLSLARKLRDLLDGAG